MKIKEFGYTLIELVVVAGIMGIIGVVSVSLFLTTLSTGGKSSGLNDIRANGDYAITQIERIVRNSVRIDGTCELDMTSLTVMDSNNELIVFSNTDSKISIDGSSIIADDVDLSGEMDFDCVRYDSGRPDEVTITFTLEKANSQVEDSDYAQAEFGTTVQLRRY